MSKKTIYLIHSSCIAALYIILTLLANLFGLANYTIQVRFSEALTILPFFTPAAIPGLAIGCFLSNLLTGCMIWDIILGTFATLLGAVGTYLLRNTSKYLAPLPPIIANTLIVPFVLSYIYRFEGSFFYFMITVGIGEILSCGILGIFLFNILQKYSKYLFQHNF